MCKEFRWTITEFYEQPYVDVTKFSIIMAESDKIRAKQEREQASKSKRTQTPRRR